MENNDDAAAGGVRQWIGRWQRSLWLIASLGGLIAPVRSLPELDPVWPGAAGLAIFALLYLGLLGAFDPLSKLAGRGSHSMRRLWPVGLGLFTALGVGLDIGYGAGPGSGWALVMVYVAVVGFVLLPKPRAGVAWLVGAAATELVIGAAQFASADNGVSALRAGGELTLVVANILLVGGLIHIWIRRDELIGNLRRTQAELAETAVQAERLRFSRDLHDLLGHTLSLIVMKAEVIARLDGQDSQAVAREAGEIQRIGRRALAEVRKAVSGYRGRGFASELHAARSALAAAGVEVSIRTTEMSPPVPVDSLLGWVVREATTNVLRHSRAQHCEIELRQGDGLATLEVRDDGTAEESAGAGSGLTGLAERLNAAGGSLEAGRSVRGGWRLVATVPVRVDQP